MLGSGAQFHISEVTTIVENHVPLLELPVRKGGPADDAIGRVVAHIVPDGACLQIGVGALPNVVCGALKDRNDLGVHTGAHVLIGLAHPDFCDERLAAAKNQHPV